MRKGAPIGNKNRLRKDKPIIIELIIKGEKWDYIKSVHGVPHQTINRYRKEIINAKNKPL